MAELNFGLLTPPGSQNIGNAFVQGMDQAAVARARENQNALSQYALGKAKREDEQQNRLYRDIQDPNFKLDVRTALRYGPQGMAALKAQQDAAVAEQTRALNQSQIAERQARLPGYVAEAFDKQMKPFSSAAYNARNVDEGVASVKAMYANPPIAAVLTKIKSLEQAIADTTAAFANPETRAQWQAYWGGITPEKLHTQATVSASTQATLAQAQRHFDGLSAYQKEQLRRQGKQFDSDRGGIVDLNTGTFEPVYLYPSSTPDAPATPAAPAAIPTAPSAAPASALPPQLNVTPGIAPSSASNVPIPQSIVGARVPPALQNVRDNDRLAILLKERADQVFLGRVDPALDREIANLQGKPTNVASQTTTQPAQRTVLGPKPSELQKTEIELNKQYTSESKGFIETKLAIYKAKAALKDAATNPTAGLSAGTAFMKILDARSVVRETELAMALESSGWFDRVTNIANTLRSGKTILTSTQITNLNKTIDGLFEEVKAEQRIVDSGYARRAKSYGLDIKNIITDRGQNKKAEDKKLPANAPPIESFRIRRR
jgi:hypothetical protein